MKNLHSYKSFINENFEEDEYPKLFDDLSEEEQELAIEKNSHINVEDEWFEDTINLFEEDLEELGLSDIEVAFSGFYSQGDGASFTSKSVDSSVFLDKAIGLESSRILDMGGKDSDDELKILVQDLDKLGFEFDRLSPDDFTIMFNRISSRYSHSNTVETIVELEDEYPDSWGTDEEKAADSLLEEIEQKAESWRKEQCDTLYRNLETEYDSLTSEEFIKETLISNNYLFDKNGEMA